MTTDTKNSIKAMLQNGQFITAPGVFDMVSAKIADRTTAQALYMTGYGVVASYLGQPDAGLATYTDMVNRAEAIVNAVDLPLIADGDTGYGGLLNVAHTARGYEKAGVAVIQIEDQHFPKKCGHRQPPRGPRPGNGQQNQSRLQRPLVRGLPDPGAHRRPDVAGHRRGLATRGSVRQGRRRHSVHRGTGVRSADAQDRRRVRRARAI